MVLEEKKYSLTEIAQWFGISKQCLNKTKEKRFEELKDYADFVICYKPSGRFSYIDVSAVKEPVYGVLNLKKNFLDWLPNGIIEVSTYAEDSGGKILSWPTVVNYYCKKNNIEYDGPHYLLEYADRVRVAIRDEEDEEFIGEVYKGGYRKVVNQEYKEWHYLYRLARKWGMENKVRLEDIGLDCCADSFNPTYLRVATKEDKEIREKIYEKWFGKRTNEEVLSVIDYISEYEDVYISKDELMQLKLCQLLTDKERRMAAAKECASQGVLKRKGYIIRGECGDVEWKGDNLE